MTFIYDEHPQPWQGGSFNFADADATKRYLEHYENWMYLSFIANNTKATFEERQQANREKVICERKLAYWRRHPNFDQTRVNEETVRIQRQWSE